MSEPQDALAKAVDQLAHPELPSELKRITERCEVMAHGLVIEDSETYEASFEMRRVFRRTKELFRELVSPGINLLDKAHKAATAFRNSVIDPLDRADAVVESKRLDYQRKLELEARQKEDKLRLEAKQQQDQELEQQAKQLETEGEPEAAQAVREQAAAAPPPAVAVQPDLPKSKGAVARKDWVYKIVNTDLIKREFMIPDEKTIQSNVNRLGPRAVAVIGIGSIEVSEKKSEHVRTRR